VAVAAASSGSDRQVRVGLVLDQPVSRRGDPVVYSAYRGLVRAARDLHVHAKAVVPPPSPTGSNSLAPFNYLARQHYDLVIAVGFLPGIAQAARHFPDVKFAALDATRRELHAPANVEGTVFHVEQAAYLAGFVAARMADLGPPPHVVSSVGGIPLPTVQVFIAGFQAGAKRADPKIGLLNAYTYDFITQAKCEHAALDQIAHGSRVVFDVAGGCGLGALDAAKRKGVFGVGVDSDQSYLGKFILTSVVKNLDAAVYDLAGRVVHGRLRTGGNLSFDLRSHGVGLGKFSPEVPLALRRELIPLAAEIEQGKIVVPTKVSRSH
jgi:basic membrane protein A